MTEGFRVPLFDLNFDDAELHAVEETLRSKWISMGPKVAELETRFAESLGLPHTLAVSSCTAALHLAMICLDIGPGDEVIVPSLTFVATANAVRYVGATPVFADIMGRDDLTIDPTDVMRKVTSRTKAVIAMHYGGFPCDMARLNEIAAKSGLYIVEDAAHAPGSRHQKFTVGAAGDVSCFSFFSNKNMSTGEGGMLVTRHVHIYERARTLRSHGMTTSSYDRSTGHAFEYDVVSLGYNYRMDDIRASIALAQLEKLSDDLRRRAELRQAYEQKLPTTNQLILPFRSRNDVESSNYILPVILPGASAESRDEFRKQLAAEGVQTSVHYPPAHQFTIYKDAAAKLPITEMVGRELVTLPLYGTMAFDDVDYVCAKVQSSLRSLNS